MIVQVIRFKQSDSTMIRKSGSFMDATLVLYNLGKDEIAARIRQAIATGQEGFTANDLIALDAGRLAESKLRVLFGSLVLARSLVSYSPSSDYR